MRCNECQLTDYRTVVAIDGISFGDDDLLDTSRDGFESVFYLWNHATAHCAVGFEGFEAFGCDERDDRCFVIRVGEYTSMLETVHEGDIEVWGKCLGCFTGNGVGIGVEKVALVVMSERSHDRHYAFADEGGEHLAVGRDDVAAFGRNSVELVLVTGSYGHPVVMGFTKHEETYTHKDDDGKKNEAHHKTGVTHSHLIRGINLLFLFLIFAYFHIVILYGMKQLLQKIKEIHIPYFFQPLNILFLFRQKL